MNKNVYLDKMSNIIDENMILKFAIMMMSAAAIISSIAAYRALDYSRTIIIPSAADKPFEVSDKKMCDNGVKMFTRQAFDLSLNFTPQNAKERFSDLMSMVHTRYYNTVREELNKKLGTIKQMNIVSTYLIEHISHNSKDKKIKTNGLRRKYTHGKEMYSSVEQWALSYEVINSNFKIVKFENK